MQPNQAATRLRWLSRAAFLILLTSSAQAQRVTASIPFAAAPSSVAVNAVTNKIYVASAGTGNSVTVIDGATNNYTVVSVGSAPNQVAVNPITNKIYVANQGDNTVTVIDGATNKTSTVATTGTNPIALAVNPDTNKIYVADSASGNVTVIDGGSNATSTVKVGSQPRAVAVNFVTNKIYVADEGSNTVTVIDGRTNSTVTVQVGGPPISAAVNPATNMIYLVAGNGLTVIDGATNGTTAVPTGVNPTQVAVNPVTNKIYVANNGNPPNYGGSVTVLDGFSNSTTTVPAGSNARAVTVDPTTNRIYIENEGSNNVTVLDGATNNTTTLAAGSGPSTAAMNPITDKLYVANSSSISVVDCATNLIIAQVTVGNGQLVAFGLTLAAVNPVTNKAYVATTDGNVTVIDGASDAVISTISLEGSAFNIAINPATNKIYVALASQSGDSVAVIDGSTHQTAYVPVGPAYASLGINPVTNKIYAVANNSITVIDGATNSATVLPLTVASNQFAYAVAVNPVTNKIYFTIASQDDTNGSVGVIDGATNRITYIADPTALYGIAVNPVTNKIYVPNGQSVTVIDGATNSTVTLPSTGNAALFVAINPITNKVYVPNTFSGTLMVIDGVTNGITTLPGGPGTVSGPFAVVVNATTNKIYLPCIDSLTIVDGATNTETSVSLPAATTGYSSTAVNPVTNKAYVAFPNSSSDPVTVAIIQDENVQALPLTTAISPVPNHQTLTFDFTAQSSTVTVPDSVYYQVDTWQNGWTKAKGSNPLFDGTLSALQPGFHTLFAFTGDGEQSTSTELSPLVGSVQAYGFVVAPPVTFAGVDTTTQGTWTGVYGSAGYLIANEAPSYLNYATVSFLGDFTYTWAGETSDPRALQTAPGASTRIASAFTQYYNTAFSINININDGNLHQVALYLLDWDSNIRNETITISDASTGQVYDSETFSNFHNGEWAIWNVRGNLNFTITPNAGPSAAVSGIFFK